MPLQHTIIHAYTSISGKDQTTLYTLPVIQDQHVAKDN